MSERKDVNGRGVWGDYDVQRIPGTARVPTAELKNYFRETAGLLGLDLGSGSGRSTGILKEALGCKLVGLDLNRGGLINTLDPAHEVFGVLGDAIAIPFGDNIFDFVNLTAVMTNFTHLNIETAREMRNGAAREVHRTLRSGGVAVISDYSTTSELSGGVTNYHGHALITREHGTIVGFNPVCPKHFEVMTDGEILRYAEGHEIDRFTHHYRPKEMVKIFSLAGFCVPEFSIEIGISPSGNQRDALIVLAIKP